MSREVHDRLRHLRTQRANPIALPTSSCRIVRGSKRAAKNGHATTSSCDEPTIPTPTATMVDEHEFQLRLRQLTSQHLQMAFTIRWINQHYSNGVSPVGDSCATASTSTMPAPRHDRRGDARMARTTRSLSPAHPHRANNGLDDMHRPYKFDMILHSPIQCPKTQEQHSWNPDDRSLNIYVKDDDPLTLHRHPVAQSTDCIRGKFGYSRGFHVWQINWPARQRGTHAVIGLGTKSAGLHAVGYTQLIGTNEDSYGWDLTRGECYHDSKHCNPWAYPMDIDGLTGEQFTPPDDIYCILDMDEGYLAFATEDKFLGVAFRNLKGKTLYPIVAAVWGHCEITMKYLGGMDPQPCSLMEICRRDCRRQLGINRLNRVDELRIPPTLKHYLLYE